MEGRVQQSSFQRSLMPQLAWPLKVFSDQKWFMRWTPQDYIQSQCEDAIRLNVTLGEVNLTMWRSPPSSPHRSKFKILNFSGDIVWCCAMTANQCWDSAGIYPTDTESDIAIKTTTCVNTVELLQHKFIYHGIVLWTQTQHLRFSNTSGTSTADTVQKCCCGWWQKMASPHLLLMLRANANCCWLQAL